MCSVRSGREEGVMAVDIREKLVEILKQAPFEGKVLDEWWWEEKIVRIVDHLIAHGVTVQECCRKAESVISKTGLMCTACHSDIDRDAVFCKYCGAKVMPQPPEGG